MSRASAVQDRTSESLRGDFIVCCLVCCYCFFFILLVKVCFDAKKRNIAV